MTAERVNSPLAAYPVGSIYMSVSSTSPATLFGGTWERITGRFLLAATDGGSTGADVQSTASAAAGASGGAATHTLTPAQTALKNHTHGPGTLNITASGGHWHKSRLTAKQAKSGTDLANETSNGNASASQRMESATHAHPSSTFAGATAGVTEANGAAHNNMPPFLAVYVWKRTA